MGPARPGLSAAALLVCGRPRGTHDHHRRPVAHPPCHTRRTAPSTDAAPGASGYAGPPAYRVRLTVGAARRLGHPGRSPSLIDSLVQLIGAGPLRRRHRPVRRRRAAPRSYDSTDSGLLRRRPSTGNTGLMVVGGLLCPARPVRCSASRSGTAPSSRVAPGRASARRSMGIMLVEEHTGRPMGPAWLRPRAGALPRRAVYIGYLWPLWDKKRQTFADKILSTVVVEVPKSSAATTASGRTRQPGPSPSRGCCRRSVRAVAHRGDATTKTSHTMAPATPGSPTRSRTSWPCPRSPGAPATSPACHLLLTWAAKTIETMPRGRQQKSVDRIAQTR